MKIWHQYPFIRLLFPFISGITLAIYLDFPVRFSLIFIILALLAIYTLLIFNFHRRITYSGRWYNGLLVNLILLCIGYEIARVRTASFDPDNISKYDAKHASIIVRVTEPVLERTNSYKIIGMPEFLSDSIAQRKVSGKIILYFQKDTSVLKIRYGDRLIVKTTLNKIRPPMNPGEFNYRRYLSHRGIYCQGFVRTGEWQITESAKGNPVWTLAYRVRNNFLGLLEQQNIKGEEFAVACALLLGCTDYLDADQIKEYSGSGAIHILSVSGLHVGIIYLFLNSLLWFLDRKKPGRFIKACLLILMIWIYALITGFSPSVLRASLMFSFIIAGEILTRKTSIYNTIGSSAMILLIINPYLITDVGFQLSYLAVIGIVWLYKPLCTLFTPRNRVIRLVWQTSVVSIAATLITFPLSLFYFKQFPNLFLVTNLIAVPLSTIIIYTGILVLATSPVNFLSAFLSVLMSKMLWFLNSVIGFIESQPFSVSRGIYITTGELFLLYLLVVTLAGHFLIKKRSYLYYAAIALLLFLVSATNRRVHNLYQKKIAAYAVNNLTALNFIDGNRDIMIVDTTFHQYNNKISYHVLNHRILSGVKSPGQIIITDQNFKNEHFIKKGNFIQFYNKSIALIDPGFQPFPIPAKHKADYLLLSNDPNLTITELVETFDFKLIIIGTSNSFWKAKQWVNECKLSGIKYYDVNEKGAWLERI